MKTKYYTIRNIEEALKSLDDSPPENENGYNYRPYRFLKALKETKPGERENVAIAVVEP